MNNLRGKLSIFFTFQLLESVAEDIYDAILSIESNDRSLLDVILEADEERRNHAMLTLTDSLEVVTLLDTAYLTQGIITTNTISYYTKLLELIDSSGLGVCDGTNIFTSMHSGGSAYFLYSDLKALVAVFKDPTDTGYTLLH